jgi:RHS repeat-associated protein
MIWDEENRLMALSDNGATSSYFYDAQGIRVLKASAGGQAVFLNSKMAGGGGGTGNFTVYVNPYLVLRSGSYTKHYYIESQKIVSKLGDTPNLGMNSTRAGEGTIDYTNKRGKIWTTIVKNLKFLGADGQILTAGKSGKIPPGQLNDAGSTGNGLNETMRFFYHPDHVGSTSYISDANGEVYQHLEYFAFGETFVEEHSNTWRTPYLFNGKELDDETGLYYYGARYYDAVTSVWQSSDPKGTKYPSQSSYNYCKNNPINAKDPEGNDLVYFNLQGEETHRVASDTEFKTYIQSSKDAQHPTVSTVGWKEVPMPKVIEERTQSGENTSGKQYQENDYVIAARTGYFNQTKNAGILNLYTEGGNIIPQDALKNIPDLDPTLVKAITIQESHNGTTGITDIMQSNVKGDWSSFKSKYSLTKGEQPNVSNSLYGGIRILATKGFKGGITYDKKTGTSTYTFKGWETAVKNYNGGGNANYKDNVIKMQKNARQAKSTDF